MGHYIEVPGNHGKADQILAGKVMVQATGDPGSPVDKFNPGTKWVYANTVQEFGDYEAFELTATPAAFADIPEGMALIVVVDNGLFEAAGYAYDEREFGAMTDPDDHRARRYILIGKALADR